MTLLPVQISSDDPSEMWLASWVTSIASPIEQDIVRRLGEPVRYWSPAVGYPGQWIWPDQSRSNALANPIEVQREPGGLYRVSFDGGLTWGLLPLTAEQLAALEHMGANPVTPPAPTPNPKPQPRPTPKPPAPMPSSPSVAQAAGGAEILAVCAFLAVKYLVR